MLLATFSINARIKDRNGVFPLEDRLRHFDPFGTEFCEAGAGQPFAFGWTINDKGKSVTLVYRLSSNVHRPNLQRTSEFAAQFLPTAR